MGQTGCNHVHTKGIGDEIDLFASANKIQDEEKIEKEDEFKVEEP